MKVPAFDKKGQMRDHLPGTQAQSMWQDVPFRQGDEGAKAYSCSWSSPLMVHSELTRCFSHTSLLILTPVPQDWHYPDITAQRERVMPERVASKWQQQFEGKAEALPPAPPRASAVKLHGAGSPQPRCCCHQVS